MHNQAKAQWNAEQGYAITCPHIKFIEKWKALCIKLKPDKRKKTNLDNLYSLLF